MKLQIFDSTLRDGAQGANVSFSVDDKIKVIQTLDRLGVDFIEAGNPFSNPAEMQFFQKIAGMKLEHAKIVAFGSTRRKGITPEEDSNLKSLLAAGTEYVAIFGKSHIMHVTDVIKATPEENLAMIFESVKFLTERGKKVVFDAEHFFDGYKTDAAYAMQALKMAHDAGAYCLCLCDTNGGIFPDEAYEITKAVTDAFPDTIVAIHCHNDGGLAVADSIEAVKAGARQIQGTFLGFGERCGNTNLSTVICNLQLKRGCECIPPEKLKDIYESAMTIADTANVAIPAKSAVRRHERIRAQGGHARGRGAEIFLFLRAYRSRRHREQTEAAPFGNFRQERHLRQAERITSPTSTRTAKEMADIVAEAQRDGPLAGYQYEAAEASFVSAASKNFWAGTAPLSTSSTIRSSTNCPP